MIARASSVLPAESERLEARAARLYARWRRAVDMLWREAVARRRRLVGDGRREQARAKSLRRIVRRALSEYHRLELERQRLAGRPRRR